MTFTKSFPVSPPAAAPAAPVVEIGQAKNPLRSAWALAVKELIWRYALRFQPAKKPICLYASRRSGSSLLMQVVSVNRGVLFSDQPFGMYTASSANINLLPIFPYGQIAGPDPEEEKILRAYVAGVLSGRIRANLPWKFWTKEFHFCNDRICLKITDAKAMIDWIDREFDVHTVVLTRHPIAQALSVEANRWFTTGKGFLRNREFVERWLSAALVDFCADIYAHGTDLEKRVTDWALENLPLLSLLPERPQWLYLGYEDLIAHTAAVVDFLVERLGLPDRRAMIEALDRPSRSTWKESTAETRKLIHDKKREELLNKWRAKVNRDDVSRCFRVLDRFGIKLYQPDSSVPDHRALGRDGFS